MRISTIIAIIIALPLIYISALYVKIEVVTGLDIKNFEEVNVPEIFEDSIYRKIFSSAEYETKILYKLKDRDLVFLTFTRDPKVTPDPTDINPYGPWEYDHYNYVKQKSTGIKNNTWPPYF